jgi:hypothetical protein
MIGGTTITLEANSAQGHQDMSPRKRVREGGRFMAGETEERRV